jgi:hypothetical protein
MPPKAMTRIIRKMIVLRFMVKLSTIGKNTAGSESNDRVRIIG